MPFNSVFSWFIKKRMHQIDLFKKFPHHVQAELFESLMDHVEPTRFGKDHGLNARTTFDEFRKQVPVRNYESIKPYIDLAFEGQEDVLWPGKVKWFAKSSGTTSSKSKYIPVTKESLEDCHYKGGKDLLAVYCENKPEAQLYNGKTLIMGGSSELSSLNGNSITGDLSAIIIENLPIWVEFKRTPQKEIALMDNWEEKIERMALTTMKEDVRLVAGVPSWTLILFKRILELTGASSIKEVWPNLELFMHGGVSFKPYRHQFDAIINHSGLSYYETYNASEGFFGLQDRSNADDMLLMLDYGILYEFMPLSELGKEYPETRSLKEVEKGIPYAMVISTNGGLWRYLIGDTVQFTSLLPYRIQVVGRTKLFVNAFGEELMIDNTEEAVRRACIATNADINDYTVAPIFMTENGNGGHEWLIEFERKPNNLRHFMQILDDSLKEVNSDYEAKRSSSRAIDPPLIQVLPAGTFYDWLKHRGKLGGQHKVPRLSNTRDIIEGIHAFVLEQNLILEQV